MTEIEPVPVSESFAVAPDGPDGPAAIAARLVQECPEFNHLRIGEPQIMFVMRVQPKFDQHKMMLGELAMPRFQGRLGPLALYLLARAAGGRLPDFIMTIDATWWGFATPVAREALVYHELCHAGIAVDREGEQRFTDEGVPVWCITPHDLEEFNAVVRRYGMWLPGIVAFVDAVQARADQA